MAGPQQLLFRLGLLILLPFPLSQAAQVFWSSPAAGTVFGPGDTLIASWTADSTTMTKGPKNSTAAFRLCETDFQGLGNGTASCGEAVTPLIQQSAGSFITTLQVSNTRHLSCCEMLTLCNTVPCRMSRASSGCTSKCMMLRGPSRYPLTFRSVVRLTSLFSPLVLHF